MNIEAIHDRVVIRPFERRASTAGGIMFTVPDSSEFFICGEVVSVGPGRLLDDGAVVPLSVKVGDKVMIYRDAGSEIQNTEGTFRTIRDEEIILILDNEQNV